MNARSKFRLESGRLLRVIPGEQQTAPLRPVMKPSWTYPPPWATGATPCRTARWEPTSGAEAVPADRHPQASRPGRPRSRGIHDDTRTDRTSRRFHSADAFSIGLDAGYLGLAHEFHAAFQGSPHKAVHDAGRVDEAVGGAETSSDYVVGADFRGKLPHVFGVNS